MESSKKSNWGSSDRKSRLPADWEARRKMVGKRDHWLCQWRLEDGSKCGLPGNQVDHIIPSGSDEPENLRVLCQAHHAFKSSSEGGKARQEALQALRKRILRPPEVNAPKQFAPGVRTQYKGF